MSILDGETVIYDDFAGHVMDEGPCGVCGVPTRLTYLLMPDYAVASHGETPTVCYPGRTVFSVTPLVRPHLD